MFFTKKLGCCFSILVKHPTNQPTHLPTNSSFVQPTNIPTYYSFHQTMNWTIIYFVIVITLLFTKQTCHLTNQLTNHDSFNQLANKPADPPSCFVTNQQLITPTDQPNLLIIWSVVQPFKKSYLWVIPEFQDSSCLTHKKINSCTKHIFTY